MAYLDRQRKESRKERTFTCVVLEVQWLQEEKFHSVIQVCILNMNYTKALSLFFLCFLQ